MPLGAESGRCVPHPAPTRFASSLSLLRAFVSRFSPHFAPFAIQTSLHYPIARGGRYTVNTVSGQMKME